MDQVDRSDAGEQLPTEASPGSTQCARATQASRSVRLPMTCSPPED